jgi:hypothetical protein
MRDAATCIAQAVALNSGGILDQIGDVSDIAAYPGSPRQTFGTLGKTTVDSVNTTFTQTFDSTTGWWTLDLHRQRIGDHRTASYTRQFLYQYRNRDSVPQRDWLTGSDTAYYIEFRIASGSGLYLTPSFSQKLDSVDGDWQVLNANAETIHIVTGDTGRLYRRVGTDTITSDGSVRALGYELRVGPGIATPRASRLFLESMTSGNLQGNYQASITFLKDSLYATGGVNVQASVYVSGGIANIRLATGLQNVEGFRADVRTGQLIQ